MKRSSADIVAEFGPFPGVARVNGVSYDGRQVWLATGGRLMAVAGGDCGLAWAENSLWVGHARERKIHQIDPATGAILRTIESNRFVSGVTWTGGELWHGTWEGDESDVRRLDPASRKVLERIEMPAGTGVSGLESDGKDRFFCGGGSSGTVRVIRRTKAP